MAHTYDLTTDIGKVRLLIGDTDITPTTDAQFSDEEIQAFLDMASASLLTAAGFALEAWAGAITDSFTAEKIGDYSYRRDTRGPYVTGVVEVDRLIQPYVRRGPVPQSV